jgi:FdhD protein
LKKVEIVAVDVSAKTVRKAADCVAEEKPLQVFLNRTRYATIFCSPTNLKELAIGHLLSEGVVRSFEEVEEVKLKEDVCRITLKSSVDLEKRLKLLRLYFRVIPSACGGRSSYQYSGKRPKVKSALTVTAEVVHDAVSDLNSLAKVFRKTGGVHAAAIYRSDGELVAFAEDVGRHNAVDKVIGIGAMGKTDFRECFLALTGRMTGDIVLKAARVGLPVVASLAAAIDSGINVAESARLTLVGFVRGKRMNVYTFPERIVL